MMKLLNIQINDGPLPIYRQVAEAIRRTVQGGILKSGDSLPSARSLAESLQVNRHTIRVAYEELVAEGWIVSEERRGYFVAADFPKELASPAAADRQVTQGILWETLSAQASSPIFPGRNAHDENLAAFPFNLQSSVPDLRLFPAHELKSCFSRALKQLSSHLDYSGVRGDPLLLSQLAEFVRRQRQLNSHEVLITQGSQEALFIAASLFLKPGCAVAVEEKGYQPAWQCFHHFGARLIPVRLDSEGICPEALESILQRQNIRLLYLTPLHQYPTTVGLSPARRIRVMALLHQYKVPLLEDDYDHDVHFDSFPPLPMAAQDPEQLVIYVSTLSKLIFPGARLGFMAVPPGVLPWFLQIKAFTSRVNETLASRAVALWMEEGGLERHIRRIRKTYHERRDHLLWCLQKDSFLSEACRYQAPKGGMNLWLDIGQHPASVTEHARAEGLLLSGGHLYMAPDDASQARHLRLGFASHNEREMTQALRILRNVLRRAWKNQSDLR